MVEIQLFDNSPPSATEEVARLRLELRDTSLQELEAIEVVVWDKDGSVVRKGERFYEKWDELRSDGESTVLKSG